MEKMQDTYSGYNLALVGPPEEIRRVQSQHNHSFYAPPQKPLNEDLEVSQFKIFPCDLKTQHNHKQCRFYHSNKDRRRNVVLESSELCKVAQKYITNDDYDFKCPKGDNCSKCHNKVEQLYCLDKYKTKFCTHYPHDCHNCEYGDYCSFAHRESEIRMELIYHYTQDTDFFIFHYKTLWCPFNYIKHDRSHCPYAHNYQDYRRKPHLYNYEPVSCGNWNPNNFITKYQQECKFKMNCTKCHGWKELQYHPRNYKTRQCSNGLKCPKGRICPYYHQPSEKRKLSDKVKSGYFTYYPRNRRINDEEPIKIEDFDRIGVEYQAGPPLLLEEQAGNLSEQDLSECSSDGTGAFSKGDHEIESMVNQLLEEDF